MHEKTKVQELKSKLHYKINPYILQTTTLDRDQF